MASRRHSQGDEAGEGAQGQVIQGLHIWKCSKGQIGRGGGSDGHWAGRERCRLGKKAPAAPLATSVLPLIVYLGFVGRALSGWDLLYIWHSL